MNKKKRNIKKVNDKELFAVIRELILSARQTVVYHVNTIQVITNFEIGRRIVEHEQQGEDRAEYGTALLKELSKKLSKEFGRGFSRSNLEYMRKFYIMYESRMPRISQMLSGKLISNQNKQIPSGNLKRKQTVSAPSQKKEAIVEITLPKGTNIYAKEYKLYLPSKAKLKKKLLEWAKNR